MVRLDFKLAYYDVAVKLVNHWDSASLTLAHCQRYEVPSDNQIQLTNNYTTWGALETS